MRKRKGTLPRSRPQMLPLSLPLSLPHSLPPFERSMEAVFWGEAGRQSVMSCQQCSDGSLTYFRKYHRISIYNCAEQHVSSHIPHGPEHSKMFSNLKCAFITSRGLLRICKRKGLIVLFTTVITAN